MKGRSLKDILNEVESSANQTADISAEVKNNYPVNTTKQIDKKEAYANIKRAFARISPLKDRYTSFEEHCERGAHYFKRKVLGYFGKTKRLTPDELVNEFMKIKMFDSEGEARIFLPYFNNIKIRIYTNSFIDNFLTGIPDNCLYFEEIDGFDGKKDNKLWELNSFSSYS